MTLWDVSFCVSALDLMITTLYAFLVANVSNDSKVPIERIGNLCYAQSRKTNEHLFVFHSPAFLEDSAAVVPVIINITVLWGRLMERYRPSLTYYSGFQV